MSAENRDFKGVWIPKEIWLNESLSVVEKCLIAEIDSLDKGLKGCFAGNGYLGKFIGVSEGRCANIICDLKKRGFIEQVYFDGRERGLRVVNSHKREISFHENVKADFTKTLEQTTRKREHINTVINTGYNNNTNQSGEFFPDQEAEKKEAPPVPQPPPAEKQVADLKTAIEVCSLWCEQNPDQIEYWKGIARKKLTDEELKTEIARFFSYYFRTTESEAHICRTNPLKFFQDGFLGWLPGVGSQRNNNAITGQNNNKRKSYKEQQYELAERVVKDRERLSFE